jgi:monoamine oxidase
MARSQLFGLLQRAARIAAASTHSRAPLDEFIERVYAQRTDASRRRFLHESSVAAAGLLLAGCAGRLRIALPTSEEEVVIVGAGIAGLTAAWRLHRAGVRVRIIEAQDRVGGRMFSLRGYFPDAQVVELGGELIDSNHVRIRALAAEMGLLLDDLQEPNPPIKSELWWSDGRAVSEAEIIRAFVPVAAAIQRDLAILGDGDITYGAPQNAQALDALTVSQWLDRNDVKGWLRKLIEVAYTTEMGLECDQQSALNLITFIGTKQDEFRIFGESDERYHVRGGNDSIPRALAEKLSGTIETGTVLEAITQRANGDYVLALKHGAASRELRASHVLLAIPFTTLRQVRIDVPLPAVKLRAIRELRYGTNAKLMIGFNQRIWRDRYHYNGSVYADLPFQTTWETTRKQPGAGGVLVNFVGGKHGVEIGQDSTKSQADKAARELDAIFPGIAATRDGAREVRMHWPSFPWTQGSYACFGPGDWTTLRGAMGETVGRLFFAGEHCAFDTQGFMEGGCETGEAAAQAILRSLGRNMPGAKAASALRARWSRRRAIA